MSVNPEEFKVFLAPYVSELPEIYQDIVYGGEVLWKGKRECEGRWKKIKGYIEPGSVVLDLGSATGYFTRRIAKEFPSCVVVSVECGEVEAEVQREILRVEDLRNVVLLKKRLSFENMLVWTNVVEGIDLLLALSVLHHYPSGELNELMRLLSRFFPEIIVEVPQKEEVEACGQSALAVLSPFDEVLKSYYPTVTELGRFASHLGDYQRRVYRGIKVVSRGGLLAYWCNPNTVKLHSISRVGGKWSVDGRENYQAGVNIWTLLQFNPIWPETVWFQKQARSAYRKLIDRGEFVSDVRPWNLLFTADGLVPIDYKSKFPKGDPAEFRESHLDKLEECFIRMGTFGLKQKW